MGDFQAIAQQFVDFYYKTFDSERGQLAALYGNDSMLTFEKDPYQGTASIVEKLQGLPFKTVQHRVDTVDAQPSHPSIGGIVVVVTGALMVEEQERPMSYTQTFQLLPKEGSWYVLNDIFRIVYPAA